MEPFWKSLCECKLLPLTTDYCPSDKELVAKTGKKNLYQHEFDTPELFASPLIRTIDDYLNEYICLRLTQNF
jgi:hypothetical protein